MGAFTDFVNKKMIEEDAKKVSSNLMKNIIDVAKEFISTEFDVSEDAKMQIINGMQIAVEQGPKFVITSEYDESDEKTIPVSITIEITSDKSGESEGTEGGENAPVEAPEGEGTEQTTEVPTAGNEEE